MSLPAAAPAFPGPGVDESDLSIRFEASVPVLTVPSDMTFEHLRSWLRGVLPRHAASVGGRTCRLDLGTRDIVLLDIRRLTSFLSSEFSIEVTGFYAQPDAVTQFAERELKAKLFPPLDGTVTPEDDPSDAVIATPEGTDAEPFTPVPAPQRSDGGKRTLPLHRTLRSGAQIRFDGDIHVYGDINPGAHVIATGNIVVFGALKGVAHAGAHGSPKSIIVAFDMRPTQLRIARQIAIPTPRPIPRGTTRIVSPEVAFLKDDAIVVESFGGRLPH